MVDWEERAILQQYRQEQRQREMIARYAASRPSRCLELEQQVQSRVLPRLARFGPVNLTTHKAPFDLWVGNCRVELKAANWTAATRGGRYQATIRNTAADVLLFVAINGTYHHYLIPFEAIGSRRQVVVTSYCVDDYAGQWSEYLENWDILRRAVAAAPARPRQLSF